MRSNGRAISWESHRDLRVTAGQEFSSALVQRYSVEKLKMQLTIPEAWDLRENMRISRSEERISYEADYQRKRATHGYNLSLESEGTDR